MKNNKITVEGQQDIIHKLGKICSGRTGERPVDKNGGQHYVNQADECALHGTYVRATAWRIELK